MWVIHEYLFSQEQILFTTFWVIRLEILKIRDPRTTQRASRSASTLHFPIYRKDSLIEWFINNADWLKYWLSDLKLKLLLWTEYLYLSPTCTNSSVETQPPR